MFLHFTTVKINVKIPTQLFFFFKFNFCILHNMIPKLFTKKKKKTYRGEKMHGLQSKYSTIA